MSDKVPDWAMRSAANVVRKVTEDGDPVDCVAAALLSAYRRGVEDSAKVAEHEANEWAEGDFNEFEASACLTVATAIRRLGEAE